MSTATIGRLALLMHLMSAGRLQLYDKPRRPARPHLARCSCASPPTASGPLELRLREFGSKQAAWVKLLRADELEEDEALAQLGPEAWPEPGGAAELDELLDAPRPLHALLRDQRMIAGIGRSWVDEILWQARLSPYKRGADLDAEEAERLRERDRRRRSARRSRTTSRRQPADPRQAADAAADPPPRGRAVPALRRRRCGRSTSRTT